ncbi:TIGR04255 family protein [Ralstonia pseudosolanacearum]|uniref:TIGR04255 family protein n=1 Tax=Ralstonia pseudosolanacearum TaxID=1310165 RepID=UPI00048BA727|nr:TIGR04255 family protein [Ralstonia pseudosolanacearum]
MHILGSWKNAPLAYVVAELRLSSILNLEPLAAALQEALADQFPRVVRGQMLGFAIDQQGVRPQTMLRFHFLNEAADACVVLTGETIGLHVTRYTNSEGFRAQLEKILQQLHRVRPNLFVERVGLRYWDIVRAEGGMEVVEFFKASMAELLKPGPDMHLARDAHELAYVVDGVRQQQAVVRLSVSAPALHPEPPNFITVPELSPSTPRQEVRTLAEQDPRAHVGYIDVDVSTEVGQTLDVAALIETTKALHASQSALFRLVTSEVGHQYWKDGQA